MVVTLLPLNESDLEFVREVRHDSKTLPHLHDQRTFSQEESVNWFRTVRPQWYVIVAANQRVGYVRTSDRDNLNRSLKIGADIHPKFRRQGLATKAYEVLLEQLTREGWDRVWLEVLPTNTPAIALYEKLGFQHEGRLVGAVKRGNAREDSMVMGRMLCPDTGRNVKVVAIYLGPRRSQPTSSEQGNYLLSYLLEQELTLDPGCPCDTVLIHNRDDHASYQNDAWVKRSESLLERIHDSATPRGHIRVINRENVGISFGAYHHAFETLGKSYDYWLFTEDDQVLVKPGVFGRAIEHMNSRSSIGFVAIVGACFDERFPPHAHGGIGVTSRGVLREVMRANQSIGHPNGTLPYHSAPGYQKQEHLGEIPFTNSIYQLGYSLANHPWDEICVSWGHTDRRTRRMIPWKSEMETAHRFRS